MKPAERLEEDGKKALAHNCAVPVIAHGMAEKDSSPVRGNLGCKWLRLCFEHARHRVYGHPGPGRTKVCDAGMRAAEQSEKKNMPYTFLLPRYRFFHRWR
jgi:hypothetical protein